MDRKLIQLLTLLLLLSPVDNVVSLGPLDEGQVQRGSEENREESSEKESEVYVQFAREYTHKVLRLRMTPRQLDSQSELSPSELYSLNFSVAQEDLYVLYCCQRSWPCLQEFSH